MGISTSKCAEDLGWEVGNIFEVTEADEFAFGDILVLTVDDTSLCPKYRCIAGRNVGQEWFYYNSDVKRIWPNPEPVETISLMGKEYSKADIEEALSNITPVK